MKTTSILYTSPELEQLHQLVAGARSQLAELEVEFAKEKSRVDAVQAVLFRQLREHYQKRDRLRLTVDYRRKFLDSLTRGDRQEGSRQSTHTLSSTWVAMVYHPPNDSSKPATLASLRLCLSAPEKRAAT